MENNTTPKTILILHGWMHSATRYHKLKNDLEATYAYKVDLYEFPGFGNTPMKYCTQILKHYATDLEQYLSHNHYDYIIAHSMGGNLALKAIGSAKPGTKLILLSPAYCGITMMKPLSILIPLMYPALLFAKLPLKINTFLAKLIALLTINKWEQIVTDSKSAHPIVAANLIGELAYDSWRAKPWHDAKHPVLVIIGEHDRIIQKSHIRKLQQDLKHCNVQVIPHIGHTAVLENYEKLLEILLHHMNKH